MKKWTIGQYIFCFLQIVGSFMILFKMKLIKVKLWCLIDMQLQELPILVPKIWILSGVKIVTGIYSNQILLFIWIYLLTFRRKEVDLGMRFTKLLCFRRKLRKNINCYRMKVGSLWTPLRVLMILVKVCWSIYKRSKLLNN